MEEGMTEIAIFHLDLRNESVLVLAVVQNCYC